MKKAILSLTLIVTLLIATFGATAVATPADTGAIGTTWTVQTGGVWSVQADKTLKCDTTVAVENKLTYNNPAVLTGDTVIEFDMDYAAMPAGADFMGFYLSGAADNAYWGLIVQINSFGYVPLSFNGSGFDFAPGAGAPITAGTHHYKIQLLRPSNVLSVWIDGALVTDSFALPATSTYDRFGFIANATLTPFDLKVANVLIKNGTDATTANFMFVEPPPATPTPAATNTPAPTATATPTTHSTPTPVPTRAPVIGVNWFGQPNPDSGDWTETERGYLHAVNIGTSKVTSIACVPPDFAVFPTQNMPKDISVEFEVKVPDAATSGWSGFYVRGNQPQTGTDGYLVFMSTAGLNILDSAAGNTVYADPINPELFTANAWHRVKITAIGTKLNVWVNGTKVVSDKAIVGAARSGNFFGASCVNYNADYRNMDIDADGHHYDYFDYIPVSNPQTGDAGNLALLALALASASALVLMRRRRA